LKAPIRRAGAKRPVKRPAAAVVKKLPPANLTPATPSLIPAITEKVKVLIYTADGKRSFLAGTDNGLYRSYDLTKGWEKLPFTVGMNDNIFAVHVSTERPDTIRLG